VSPRDPLRWQSAAVYDRVSTRSGTVQKRFTDGDQPDRFARRIATHLAPPLKDLTNGGEDRTD